MTRATAALRASAPGPGFATDRNSAAACTWGAAYAWGAASTGQFTGGPTGSAATRSAPSGA